jgi:hypothetical protein
MLNFSISKLNLTTMPNVPGSEGITQFQIEMVIIIIKVKVIIIILSNYHYAIIDATSALGYAFHIWQ